MSREQPYKSKNRPTVIGLAKHKTEIALKDHTIDALQQTLVKLHQETSQQKSLIQSLTARLEVKDAKIHAMRKVNDRERLIVNKLIGYEEN